MKTKNYEAGDIVSFSDGGTLYKALGNFGISGAFVVAPVGLVDVELPANTYDDSTCFALGLPKGTVPVDRGNEYLHVTNEQIRACIVRGVSFSPTDYLRKRKSTKLESSVCYGELVDCVIRFCESSGDDVERAIELMNISFNEL